MLIHKDSYGFKEVTREVEAVRTRMFHSDVPLDLFFNLSELIASLHVWFGVPFPPRYTAPTDTYLPEGQA